MSISELSSDSANAVHLARPRRFEGMHVGQRLKVDVLSRLDGFRYAVKVGPHSHVLESSIELLVGHSVDTRVVAVGDRLELRFAANGEPMTIDENGMAVAKPADQPEAEDWTRLATSYGVRLSSMQIESMTRTLEAVPAGNEAIRAALYLAKLDSPINTPAVVALSERIAEPKGPLDKALLAAVADADYSVELDETLAEQIQQVLDSGVFEHMPSMTDADAGGDFRREDKRAYALWLLNLQDGGRTHYRYASLPLLVDGRLTEIDLALFQDGHREMAGERRLVLTLQTTALGTVRVVVKSVAQRLSVEIGSDSASGIDTLAKFDGDFRKLLSDHGWQVDRITYSQSTGSAATDVVEHVLKNGSIDRHL